LSSGDLSAYSHGPNIRFALFLDDLQWLDAATLDLLAGPFDSTGCTALMLIGAYRTTKSIPPNPLMRKLEAIRQAGAMVQEIILAASGA